MDFIESRLFDEQLLTGTSGGPRWSTTVTAMQSGKEQRQVNWSRQRANYNVGGRLVDAAQLESTVEHFNSCQGMAIGFRWRDVADHTVTRARSLLKPMGDGRSYALHKTYSLGPVTRERKISKPAPGTFELWIGGAPSTAYSIDATTGIVQLDPIVTAGMQISNSIDELNVTIEFYDAVLAGDVIVINDVQVVTVAEKLTSPRLRVVADSIPIASNTPVALYPQPSRQTLEAACEFDLPVRFDTDELDYTYAGGSAEEALYDLASLPVVELKL